MRINVLFSVFRFPWSGYSACEEVPCNSCRHTENYQALLLQLLLGTGMLTSDGNKASFSYCHEQLHLHLGL